MRIAGRVKVVCLVLSFVLAGCGSGASDAPMGTERGPCYGNGTCNPGLECMSDVCVRPAGTDAIDDPGVRPDIPGGYDAAEDLVTVPDGCTPSCAGRQCGGNGCGGSCGTCPEGKTCNGSGACTATCASDAYCDADCISDPDCVPTEARLRLIDFQQVGSNLQVFVSITDKATGQPINGLENRVRVYEDDLPLSVEGQLSVTPRPQDYGWITLVLIDTSYSILSTNGLPVLADAVKGFAYQRVARNSNIQRVALGTFDGAGARWVPEHSWEDRPLAMSTRGQIDDAITHLLHGECENAGQCPSERPECVKGRCIDRSTDLYGSVTRGMEVILNQEGAEWALGTPKGRAVVVLTDGSDQAGIGSLQQVHDMADWWHVNLFAVGIGADVDPASLEALGRDGTVRVDDVSTMEAALEDVGNRMERIGQGIYLVSYCTPKRQGSHDITLRIQDLAGELTLPFQATNVAECNPNAAAAQCAGLSCGHSKADYYEEDPGFWCGACAGDQTCLGGGCTATWIRTGRIGRPGAVFLQSDGFWGLGDDVWHRSDDGIAWTPIPDAPFSPNYGGIAITRKNGRIFAFQEANVWSSADGVAWTLVTDSFPVPEHGYVAGVHVRGDQFWVFRIDNTGYWDTKPSLNVWRSTDGAQWTSVGSPAGIPFENGTRVQVHLVGDTFWLVNDRLYSSSDGVAWQPVSGELPGFGAGWSRGSLVAGCSRARRTAEKWTADFWTLRSGDSGPRVSGHSGRVNLDRANLDVQAGDAQV